MIANALLNPAALSGLTLTSDAAGAAFHVQSADIKPGATMASEQTFNGFGCTGQNVSPALEWSGAPKDTKSFAVLVHDPDAAKGAGKADGSALPPGAASAVTDFGSAGYGGPCPPEGDKPHRYLFTVYALKTDKLDVPKGATASLVGFMVNANAIARTTLTGMYGRKK